MITAIKRFCQTLNTVHCNDQGKSLPILSYCSNYVENVLFYFMRHPVQFV